MAAVFNPLSISDLRKDQQRPLNFINKVKDGNPFITVNNGEVVIDKKQLAAIKGFMTADQNKFPAKGSTLIVKTNKGNLTVPKDFLKSGEFGGKGQGSGVAAETLAMNDFNDKLNKILQTQGVKEIKIKINGRTIKCAAMVKTEGKYQGRDPKSDMTLVDGKGNPQAYISHKAGKSAKDYQQYGGLSYRQYESNQDIKKFMNDVLGQRPGGLQSGDSFYRVVKDKKLVADAMYGPEFSSGRPGVSNVDEFHLGFMNLKGKGSGPYTIESIHKGTNGEMPEGDYQAIFFIRFQDRRGAARAGGVTVPNARVGIFPMAKKVGTSQKI